MKKEILLSLLMVLFLLNSSLFTFGGDIVNLSKTSYQQSEMPYILVLKNGDILAIWSEGYHFNAQSALYYSIRSKETGIWSAPTVAVKPNQACGFVQCALDDDGDVHIAYFDGSGSDHRDIYYATYSNGKWSKRFKVYENDGQNDAWPRIRVEGKKIYIMWAYNYHPEIGYMDIVMVENEKGGIWPVDKQLRQTVSDFSNSTSIHCDFDVKDGNIYATWMDDNHGAIGNWNIYYNERVDGQWKTPYRLNPSWNQYYPSITVDDKGTAHLVYGNKTNPVWYQQKSSGLGDPTAGWSTPEKITNGATFQVTIQFIKYAKGLLHAMVKQGGNVFYVRGLPDGRWAEPVKVAEGIFPEYMGCDVDAEGNVHAIWSDGPAVDDPYHRDVYYTKVELPGTPPTAVIKATPTSGLFPLEVKFDGSESTSEGGKILKYEWTFGDEATAEGKKVTHTYQEVGTYTASLYVLDDNILSGSSSVQIEVLSGQPVASFDYSPDGGLSPIKITFDASASSDPDGQLVSYDWDFGDGSTDQGVTVTHRYTYGSTFSVSLTVKDNDGKTDLVSKDITIFEKPTASFTASPTVGIAPLEVQLDASASSDPDGELIFYNWDFGDGEVGIGKQKTRSHTFLLGGTYHVVLTVVDNDYYMATASQWITVYNLPFPPLNVSKERLINKTFLFIDCINKITWEENPQNSAFFNIVNYRIYRKEKGKSGSEFSQLAEVNSSIFEYEDRGFTSQEEADKYVYAVSAVDDQGRESPLTQEGSVAVTLQNKRGTKKSKM